MDLPKLEPFVALLLFNGVDANTMQHTTNIFEKLQIPFESIELCGNENVPNLLTELEKSTNRCLKAVVFGTHYSYTDEQFPSISEFPIFSFKVITGSLPTDEQLSLNTATTGFGEDGARNAGLFVAGVLALEDTALSERLKKYRGLT